MRLVCPRPQARVQKAHRQFQRSQYSGQSPFSDFRSDRCKRLTADIAAMAVNILNRYADNATVNNNLQNKEHQRCIDCHGQKGEGIKVSTKMNCTPCHTMDDHYE